MLCSFMLLLPLASGITIQFGGRNSGMRVWQAVRRVLRSLTSLGSQRIPSVKLPVWSLHMPASSPRHNLVWGATDLGYFTGIKICWISTQPCLCFRLVPYQLGTAGFASTLVSTLADELLMQSCGIFTPCFNTATCQWIHESVHR